MDSADRSVSRRQLLRGAAATTLASAGVGSVTADDPEGPFLTKINSAEFGGYFGAAKTPDTPGAQPAVTTDFVVPDLSLTPYTIKTVHQSGVGVPTGGLTLSQNGELYPEAPPRFTVPRVDPDDYDGEIVRYQLVGDLTWEPTTDGPDPSYLDYAVSHYIDGTYSGFVNTSWGCEDTDDGKTGYVWDKPRQRIFTWLYPEPCREYMVGVEGYRGVSRWEAELEVQVVVAEPRPRVGNENGFANADAETFEQYKPTSMDRIAGYRVVTRPEQTAIGEPHGWHVGLRQAPRVQSEVPQCPYPDVASSNGESFSVDVPASTSYRYLMEPYSSQREWHISTDVYKVVTKEPQPISWTDEWPYACWPEVQIAETACPDIYTGEECDS